jgi:peptidoglycan/LPS O-acetylase OafA/YrhL
LTSGVIAGLAVLFFACTVPLKNWLMMSGAVLIITGLKNDDGIGRILFGNPFSVLLGNVSYALYLFTPCLTSHWNTSFRSFRCCRGSPSHFFLRSRSITLLRS